MWPACYSKHVEKCPITSEDMHYACETIHKNTGDPIQNHESIGGNWSVAAVLQALQSKGLKRDSVGVFKRYKSMDG